MQANDYGRKIGELTITERYPVRSYTDGAKEKLCKTCWEYVPPTERVKGEIPGQDSEGRFIIWYDVTRGTCGHDVEVNTH